MIFSILTFRSLNLFYYYGGANKLIFFATVFFFLQLCASFMMTLSYGYLQIKALNKFLVRTIQGHRRICIPNVIKKVSILYDSLCDLHDSISTFYMLTNLIFLMGFAAYHVIFFYSLYVYLKNPSIEQQVYLLAVAMWCFFHTPCMVWIMTFSSWIESEACKTAELTQLLANQDELLEETLRSSFIMTLQTNHRKPKIKCGLFDLNFKMLFTTIAGIFSFSIISIQFYDVAIV